MNTPGTPAGETPARPAGQPCAPSSPVAGQGTPAREACESVSRAGPKTPGAAPAEGREAHLRAAPGTSTWIVALPPGLEPLSLNQRLHWSVQRKRAAELKKAAWAVALRERIPHLASVRITVVYHPPDRRRRDHDNTPAVMGKHAIDGIVAAGVLEDDCPPNISGISYSVGEIVKGGQLVLHLTEVTA